jgi:hypothetical protein
MRKSKRLAVTGLLVFAALLMAASACDGWRKTPTPTPVPSVSLPIDVLAARDTALAHVQRAYAHTAPPQGLAWLARPTQPLGQGGTSCYELVSGTWLMSMAVPTLAPGQVLYEIGLNNSDTGFQWVGSLNARYEVLQSNLNVAVEALVARDSVLSYLRELHADKAPALNLAWVGQRSTPEGLAGHESCRFNAADWVMTVEYDVLPPDQVSYQVGLYRSDDSFAWRGQVDAQGVVLEERLPG